MALPLFRRAGDPIGEAATPHNLGNVDQRAGPLTSRRSKPYQQALGLDRAAKYRAGEAKTLTNLAELYPFAR